MSDSDQEKIPFIDEAHSAAITQKNSSPLNIPTRHQSHNNPKYFLEMESPRSSTISPQSETDDQKPKISQDSTLQPSESFPDRKKTSIDNLDYSITTFLGKRPNDHVKSPEIHETEERNSSFKFPIHSAAQKGNVKQLEKLLALGDPLATDFKERTPLHYACGFAYQKKALKMLDAILECRRAQNTPDDHLRKKKLIDYQDKNGETGLHIAARTGHRLVVEKLLFSAADVNLRDKNGYEPLEVIYSKVPAAMIPVFDGAVECKVGDPNDQNLIVRFDFGAIVGYPEIEKDISIFQMETKLLSYCLQQSEAKRSAILLHPIVQVFLFLKWKKIRILLWISILYHVIWLLLYTLFITDLYLSQCPYRIPEGNDTDYNNEWMSSNETSFEDNSLTSIEMESENRSAANITNGTTCEIGKELLSSLNIKLSFLFFVSISVAIKELYEIRSTPQLKFYFLQLENVGQWLLIGVVALTSIPIFVRDDDNAIVIHAWQYQASALGIFLAWSLILSQIGKLPRFGIYIEILGKVLRSFVMFMITFASLLVAFTVAFQILMPEKIEFRGYPWVFLKVMVMMVGEINYDEVFFSDEAATDIPFPTSTKLLYAAFVSVVTIILFNLLIGLTVSDTQGLQSVAQLTSLSSQLDQIYLMEKFIISKKLQRWLKTFKKNHWLRYFLVTQQNDDLETNMGLDIHISKVPSNLQHQVREVAIPNTGQEKDEDDDDSDTNDEDKKAKSANGSLAEEKANVGSTSQSSISTIATNDLKEQIRDVLRELLEELKIANQNNRQSDV